ncbi:MAG: hypothetical protein HY645_10845 [Acidobacteria bacterium]|nr:hypothetical protein [Acidobacteriota bacterium]
MSSRNAQDVILRLLADGPYRRQVLSGKAAPEELKVASRIQVEGLQRFAVFLARHFYRERVVHLLKYSRALSSLTGRSPESVLKTPAFNALIPEVVLGSRATALQVAALLRDFLVNDCENIQQKLPYWKDLVQYETAFFVTDSPLEQGKDPAGPFPFVAPGIQILNLDWDLPSIFPSIMDAAARRTTQGSRKPTRLLMCRAAGGEVTVARCSDSVEKILRMLDGNTDPEKLQSVLGKDEAWIRQTLSSLFQIGVLEAPLLPHPAR